MSGTRRFLVDGNNVMGQRVGWHRDRAGARLRLVRELAEFARQSGAAVSVVFDHDSTAQPDEMPGEGSVRVCFSGRKSTADDYIVELVASDPNPESFCVVTSDRELRNRVRALGARTMRSGDLRRKVDEALTRDRIPSG